MHVIFEDDGQLKAGTVLAEQDSSLHVEAASGKRLKVKAANVLLRFADPSPAEALAQGQKLAAELDPGFLWEAVGEGEFAFDELAREYYGAGATPVERLAVAMLLYASPMYFYKRGKGRYRKAPQDALRAALASVERKARESVQVDAWVEDLVARRLPDAFRPKLSMLLYKPDKTALEWKALSAACDRERRSPLALLFECGAIPSTHDYHFNRFLAETFPRGADFTDWGPLPAPPELPLADVRAFSIDDHTTTEIDDAFSVRELPDGTVEIGIHIAAPALSMPKGSRLDAIARERLSTVYMPGRKLTMLPDPVVDAFTLREDTVRPALSLYVVTTHDGVPLRSQTRVNAMPVAANLRLDEVGDAFANDLPSPSDPPWTPELRALRKLARHLNAQRGKTDVDRIDYSFYVDWAADAGIGEPGRVAIVPRPRGSPLDRLISELMIFVNNTWGKLLAERGATGLYRTQGGGKVKMSTRPGEHQGLGLTHYLWASSPLRRYSDLVNQRQLLAVVAGERPPHPEHDAELFAALADFEATYGQYAEFQDRMEHYWCLRWLVQERVTETTASVIRENLVRFDRLPLVMRLADLPNAAPGTPVRVAIGAIDLLAATVECRVAGTGSAASAAA
ncbi:MAG TPA: RNB domain-containing ribonuclease [Casimicrobiaceae bacterium]|nr:RNB domain-containing ribonuclease [Casimicrobiaceae bacterium]